MSATLPPLTDDLHRVTRWQGGDREAGAQLIEAHYDGIARFFHNKVGDAADDLVQRTFLVAMESSAKFRGDSSFRTFLFGVARNVLFDHYRDRQRSQRVDPDFGLSSVFDLDPSPSQVVARRGEERLLLEALRRIPLELQVTVELFYWEGVSIRDLAQIQEVAIGTIKSRLHRARRLLVEQIEGLDSALGPRMTSSRPGGQVLEQTAVKEDVAAPDPTHHGVVTGTVEQRGQIPGQQAGPSRQCP